MFAKESLPTWIAFVLLGIAALVFELNRVYRPVGAWHLVANFGVVCLVLLSMRLSWRSAGSLNRNISNVYRDVISGQQPPRTLLHILCSASGMLLLICMNV
ncbi:MAG: hypothetical protein ABI451_13335 [Dokdonella sp.]